MPSLQEFLFGTGPRIERIERFDQPQQQAIQQLLQMGLGGLGQAMQPFDVGPIEERARTQFQQRTIPSLLERLTSMGAGASPNLQRQLFGQAGADLESQLAGLRTQTGLQQRGQQLGLLQNLLGLGLQPMFEPLRVAPTQGFAQTTASSLLPFLGQALGGPIGGALGGGIGSGLSSLLSQFGR